MDFKEYMVSAVITHAKGWPLDMFNLKVGDRVEGFLCKSIVQKEQQEVQIVLQVQVSEFQLINVEIDAGSIRHLNS